jgi:colanic acid biosynthesis glycosyl transferase WcaI
VRLIFLNRFYWPDEPATGQLLADLATALAARGDTVTVITSRPASGDVPPVEVRNGVRILRVRGTRWGRHHLAGRAVDFATFLLGALGLLIRTAGKGDIVVALTDPPLLGLAVWPAARWRNARCVHWIQDVFPEVALTLKANLLVRAAGAALRPLRNLAWRRSDCCVAVSHDMASLIARTGVSPEKIRVIPNWAPAGMDRQTHDGTAELRRAWKLAGKFIVAYSGNLGRVHDFSWVVETASLLQDQSHLAFVFIGDGAQRDALAAAVQARGLANIHFHPPQPRAQLAITLALGDVHLVTLRAGCEALVFPSKLYGIAAVGRPVVFVGPKDCEVARLVEQHGFGVAFTPEDPAAVAGGLQGLAADPVRCALLAGRAREFSRTSGQLDHALAAWVPLLSREAAC